MHHPLLNADWKSSIFEIIDKHLKTNSYYNCPQLKLLTVAKNIGFCGICYHHCLLLQLLNSFVIDVSEHDYFFNK